MINIKNLDPNKMKIDEKPCKNIFIYNIGFVTMKVLIVLHFIPSYLHVINKTNGSTEESNRNKYLTIVPSNKSNSRPKKKEELWNKIRNSI